MHVLRSLLPVDRPFLLFLWLQCAFVRLFIQILANVGQTKEYKDGRFYVFVCKYEVDSEDVATITHHGVVAEIVGADLHKLTYNDLKDEEANKKLGHKLARDEVIASVPAE